MKKFLGFMFSLLLFSGCYSNNSFEWIFGKTEKLLKSFSAKKFKNIKKVGSSIGRLKKEQELNPKTIKYCPQNKAKFLETVKNFIKACKKKK